MAATSQSTTKQNGGHQRVLATYWWRYCHRSLNPWPVRPATSSHPGPVTPAAATTTKTARLLGLTFGTDATIDRVEAGHLLEWRAHDRQKQLQGSRLVEATGPASRFTEVVEGRLLGLSRP